MPMRAIGMLIGIPEEDQKAIREQIDEDLRIDDGADAGPREADGARRRSSASTSTGASSTPPTT